MRNLSYTVSFFLFMLVFSSCSKKYATSYPSSINNHGTLAILPFELNMVGEIPPFLSEEEIQEIERMEALRFQKSMYFQFQEEPLFKRNRQWVQFQHYKTTNDKLRDAEISMREAWQMSPEALADILGVDAVVRTKVNIEHTMNRGISIAVRIFDLPPVFDPRNWHSNSRLYLFCSILDGNNGSTVWTHSVQTPSYPYRSSQNTMDDLNERVARQFPYKNYRY